MKQAAGDGHGFGRSPVQKTNTCAIANPQAMGAGSVPNLKLAQTGGGQTECVDGCNQFGPAGYGFKNGDNNALFRGSGYPEVSSYNSAKRCTKGGRKLRRKKHKTRRKRKKRKTRRKKKRGRKKRGGGIPRTMKLRQFANKWGALGTAPFKGGKRKSRGGKRKTMRGGYHQFGSNSPSTPGLRLPKPGNLPWATGPLSKTRQINSIDNYNHYSGKGSLSPILDGDVA